MASVLTRAAEYPFSPPFILLMYPVLQGTQGWLATAPAATGQRSLTAYLTMSAFIAIAFAAWGFDAGSPVSVTVAAGVAFACWAGAVLLCVVLERAGRPGPADALLRRMLYRRSSG